MGKAMAINRTDRRARCSRIHCRRLVVGVVLAFEAAEVLEAEGGG